VSLDGLEDFSFTCDEVPTLVTDDIVTHRSNFHYAYMHCTYRGFLHPHYAFYHCADHAWRVVNCGISAMGKMRNCGMQ